MATIPSEIEMQDIEPEPEPELPFESGGSSRSQTTAPSAHPSSGQYSLFDRIVEHNLKYLRIVSKLGILPFEVDVDNRRVFSTKSTLRWSFFYFIRFACLFKGIYVALALIASLLNPNWMQVLHLCLYVGMAFLSFTIPVYSFRPKALRLSPMIVNAALSKRDRVKSFSRQQFMAAIMPIGITTYGVPMAFGSALLTTLIYQFGTLYRAVSTEWDTESAVYGFLRVIAYALDAFPFLWIIIGLVCTLMFQILILEVLHSWCIDLRSKTNRFNLADCYAEMVDIQIVIVFFNQIFKEVAFLCKLCSLGTGIMGFVLVFWYGFNDHIILNVANMYVGIGSLLTYPLIYEKAALISGSMELAKKSLLMATAGLEDENERAFWRRRVKAIRIISLMCGPRPVERESLLLFYEFFISKFIDVLLTTT